MLYTTLSKIRDFKPCAGSWTKLLLSLDKTRADDEPLPFSVILDSNGLDDALWCCRSAPEHNKHWRLYAVWCARQVEHLMDNECSRNALDVAERYAHGIASDHELNAAWVLACTASRVSDGSASGYAARAATWSVAGYASGYEATCAVGYAVGYAARAAAGYASKAAQAIEFRRLVTTEE